MKRLATLILFVFLLVLAPLQNSSAATTIGGIVNSDLVLTKSKSPYSLSSTLQIPAGVTVTVEAGVEVESHGTDVMFWNQGILNFKGTKELPILLSGKPSIYVLTKGSEPGSELNITGVLFNGGGTIWSNAGYSGYFSLVFEDSEIKDVSNFIYVWYLLNKAVIQRNVFINSGGLSVGFNVGKDVSILNNLFIGPSTTGYWIESWASYGGQLEVHNNEFRGGPYTALRLAPDAGRDAKMSATSNFWGNISVDEISRMVNDRNDSLSYANFIDISSPLSQSAPGTPTGSILQAAADKAAADALAAQQAAQAKAAADKAAADALAAQQAAQAKAAADKAAADALAAQQAAQAKAAADRALADAQAMNQSLQGKIQDLQNSLAALTAQLSKVTALANSLQASLYTTTTKLSKICSVKPKPKGC